MRKFHDQTHHAFEVKLKCLIEIFMPLKMFGSAIFSGLMILYMVSGVGFAFFAVEESFNYSIPFAFVLQGLLLSALISLLWGVLFSDVFIKKWRRFQRLIVFSISLTALLAACVMTFVTLPTDWANLWLVTCGLTGFGLIVFAFVNEARFKATGKRYTEVLNKYKAENLQ